MTDPKRPDLCHEPTRDTAERRRRVNERLRAAYIEGAEEDSRRRLGRGLTDDEFARVLRRYPGALANSAQGRHD